MNDCPGKRKSKWIFPIVVIALCLVVSAAFRTNGTETPSEAETMDAIQNYLDLRGTYCGSPAELLEKLNLLSFDEIGEPIDDGYIKSSISYEAYKKAMLSYMTEQCFESSFTQNFRNADGALCYFNGGATGFLFEVKSVAALEDGSGFIALADSIHPDESREEVSFRFGVEYRDGKWIVAYCE